MDVIEEEVERRVQDVKNYLTSIISHEIRTPLAIARGYLSLFMDGTLGNIAATQKDKLFIIENHLARLTKIVNDILNTADIQHVRTGLARSLVNFEDLVDQALFLVQEEAIKKSITLRRSFHLPREDVFLDPDKILIVIQSLLHNAVRFSPSATTITITVSHNARRLIVTVQDQGPGIAKDDQKRIFERFVQLGRVDGGGEKGLGVGLTLAKEYVEAHRGEIEVASDLGQGTTFTFRLPYYKPDRMFARYFTAEFHELQKSHKTITLVILRLLGFAKLTRDLGAAKCQLILIEAERLLKRLHPELILKLNPADGEIVIFFTDQEKTQVEEMEHRLRDTLNEHHFSIPELPIGVTFASGKSSYPEDAKSELDLLAEAEISLNNLSQEDSDLSVIL